MEGYYRLYLNPSERFLRKRATARGGTGWNCQSKRIRREVFLCFCFFFSFSLVLIDRAGWKLRCCTENGWCFTGAWWKVCCRIYRKKRPSRFCPHLTWVHRTKSSSSSSSQTIGSYWLNWSEGVDSFSLTVLQVQITGLYRVTFL